MPRLALVLIVLALASCAPTHEWVAAGRPLAARESDMRDCRYEADHFARRQAWFEHDRLRWESWSARSPGERAMVYTRLNQLEMQEQMDRSRFFDRCMHARGYALRPIDERLR